MVSVFYLLASLAAVVAAYPGRYDYSLSVVKFSEQFPLARFGLDEQGRHLIISDSKPAAIVDVNSALYAELDELYDKNVLLNQDDWNNDEEK